MELVEAALNHQPASTLLREQQRRIFNTYSKSLQQFCRRYSQVFLTQIACNYNWTPTVLQFFIGKIYHGHLQSNESTIWTFDLISQFQDVLLCYTSSPNITAFLYNKNIYLRVNEMIDLNRRLFERYQYMKATYPSFAKVTLDVNEPIYLNRIPEYYANNYDECIEIDDHTKFQDIKFVYYNWTEELIDRYFMKVDWWQQNVHLAQLPWTLIQLEKIKALRPERFHVFCAYVRLTETQVSEFKSVLNWEGISKNEYVCCSVKFFKNYERYLLPHLKSLSKNKGFEWGEEFISEYKDSLAFDQLSDNPGLPWSYKLLMAFQDKWYFNRIFNVKGLCSNPGIYWTTEMLEAFKNKIEWDDMAHNQTVEWTLTLAEKYAHLRRSDQYFVGLSYNTKLWKRVFKGFVDDDFLQQIVGDLNHNESINSY